MFREPLRPVLWILDQKKQLPDIEKKPIISPLHYGDTVEIFFVKGIEGEVFINGKRFEFEEKNIFFIPPKNLHTSTFIKGGSKEGDIICSLHINIKELSSILNLKNLLMKDNFSIFNLAFRCRNYDNIWEIVQSILDENRTFMSRIVDLIHLFEMIASQKSRDTQSVEYSNLATSIIDFVEENYDKIISIQDVANHFGYSKQYFCKWFKINTGSTFNEFLNAVRINHSCVYLSNGYSVKETAEKCGFSDSSYFTKVFKRYQNITPKTYTTRNKSHVNIEKNTF